MTDQPDKGPGGRPTIFSQELCDAICARIADGESLRSICRDDGMPSAGTVCRWLAEADKAAFREQYTRARDAQADALFDEILDISDDGRNDWMERHGKDNTGWQLNGEHIQRSRLRVDARKWAASKLAPKKYGEKIDLNHGGQPDNPVSTVSKIVIEAATAGKPSDDSADPAST